MNARWPERDAATVPVVDAPTMLEVDRVAERRGLALLQMMENAGRSLADVVVTGHHPASVVVLVGTGGNGGGGMVAARHLADRGVAVSVHATGPPATDGVPAHQRALLGAMGGLVDDGGTPPAADVVIDAVIGYSLTGELRGRAADLVAWANDGAAPVVALDVPSGFDATTGRCGRLAVRADTTLTLALPKRGLVGAPCAGDVLLADISVFAAVYAELGIDVPADLFADAQVVALR